MSFMNKFKPTGNPPPGVKIEHTSFGYAQNKTPYAVPTLPKQNAPAPKTQPRGGWDDDDDDEPQLRGGAGGAPNRGITVQTQLGGAKKPFVQSPATSGSTKSDDLNLGPSTRKAVDPAKDYALMQIDEQFLSSHGFENNAVNDIIQPGGARLKPTDTVLNNFCKQCESFQIPVIGTLLLSKLYEDIPFISKARTLYLIEAIVKKVKKYLEYFKHNLSTLQNADYSNEGSADQLIKIRKDIIEYIQEPNKPKLQPSFPTNLTHYSNPTPVPQTTNLLGGDDLLGSPEAKTSKPDPFGFVKKQASDTTKAQTPSSRPPVQQQQQKQQQNNNQLLDLDFGSAPSQPQQSFTQPQQSFAQPQQAFTQPQQTFTQPQVQAQPKKFNPFEIPSQGQQQNKPQPQPQPVTQPISQPQPQVQVQNTAKPSGLNFKKFQAAQESTPTQQANKPTPTNQGSGLNQMDDLLSNLDFSSGSTQQTTSMPNTFSQSTNLLNSSPQAKSSFPTTQAPVTQPSFNQPPSQPSTSFGQSQQNQYNTPNQGFNTGLNANKFPQTNMPNMSNMSGPQMNAPYGSMQGGMGGMGPGNMGNMGPGPTGYGYNAFPGYGQGPSGFNNAPQGNWNTGYPGGQGGFNKQGGQGGFNQQGGQGFGYGQQQQQQYPMGGFGQGQNFGGNNFQQQGFNSMGGGYQQNQGPMQGMNYYNQPQPHSPGIGGDSLGLYSEEAIANQEAMKKKYEKAKNEQLFENLKF